MLQGVAGFPVRDALVDRDALAMEGCVIRMPSNLFRVIVRVRVKLRF